MSNALEGKCCLVTGGTKGIGKAIVESLAFAKARVMTCSRNKEHVNALVEELRNKGYDVQGCVCDVSNKSDITAMVNKVTEAFGGKLHVLVNNAGTNIRKKAIEFSDEEFAKIMSTNFKSAYELTRMSHSLLTAAEGSSVVFISSISAGTRAVASGLVYAISKASMDQMTKTLAREWADDHIRVNSVAPGYVYTPLTAVVLDNESFKADVLKETPLKRFGDVEEIASVVAFLSGSRASYITGQVLNVDGGYSVRGVGY